jgi:CrcB protein
MANYFWVAIGGALGSVARHWASNAVAKQFGEAFPWGTLIINVTGSFLIGFFGTVTAPNGRWPVGWGFRTFFMVGICGGYTTFSAFSLQTLRLLESREWLYAGLNILGSVVLCLLAIWLGHTLAMLLNARQ